MEKTETLQELVERQMAKMPRGTYLVDMDGVLFDYAGRFEKMWNAKYPDAPFSKANQRFFYVQDNLPKMYESLAEEMIDSDPLFFEELEPLEGAIEGIKTLAKFNPVYICTSPNTSNDYCVIGKLNSIKKHLGKEWIKKTIITKDKTAVKGDFLIDDRQDTTGNFNKSWIQLYYEQPYNIGMHSNRFSWTKGIYGVLNVNGQPTYNL